MIRGLKTESVGTIAIAIALNNKQSHDFAQDTNTRNTLKTGEGYTIIAVYHPVYASIICLLIIGKRDRRL